MKTYSDYRSKAGIWYTFRPLNVLKREELASRFNSFDKSMTIAEQLVADSSGQVVHNLKQILRLYELDIFDFEFEEFDELLVEHLLKVNYTDLKYEEESVGVSGVGTIGRKKEADYGDILTNLISSTWGITESAGDAMYLIEKLPAELLIGVIKKRSEVLERMYSSDEDKRKKQTKDIKETLKEQVKQRMLEMQKKQK